jgi:predicted dehydrogenase
LTESGSHKDLSLELLQYGKPVLVEKPLTLSVRDANELVDAFNKLEIPLFVVKQNRLNPPVARAFSDLKKGLLGELIFASATVLWARHPEYYLADTWRLTRDQDGGVVWNQASHYVDLLVQALGTVESVFAYGANFLSPAETEDTVFAVLKSKSGAIGSLQATTTIRPKNFEGSLILSGDGGLVKVGGHALNETVAATNTALEVDKEALESDSAEVYGKSHSRLYLDIFEDLEGKRDSGFRAADAIQVVAVMEAIHLSINTKSEVLVREILESAK